MRSALITGVSSGIGLATAELLVSKGWRVFGGVRNRDDGEALADRFGQGFEPLIFDLRDGLAIDAAARQVSEALGRARLSALVNNAGVANFGPLALQPVEDWSAQIEINLVGTLRMVQAFLPLIGTDGTRTGPAGRIVNISSVSGRMTLPFMSGYAASKHGVEALSDAMRRELAPFGIRTIVIRPGPVGTSIWEKVHRDTDEAYRDSEYGEWFESFKQRFIAAGRKAHSAESFARLIHTALTNAKPRTHYTRVRGKFFHWTLPLALPHHLLDRLLVSALGLSRAK